MSILLIACGLGCIWHGGQIIWAAPTPTQFLKQKPEVEPGSPGAFQVFWLDQYAWIGISLVALGLLLAVVGVLV